MQSGFYWVWRSSGFFPGMLLYLTYWVPRTYLPRFTAAFMVAIPLSFVVGGPLASLILELDGVAGLHGWQWLFLIEGVPAALLAFAVLRFLPDGPARADWLSDDEKQTIVARLAAEEPRSEGDLWSALLDLRVIVLGFANFCFQAGVYGVTFWLPQIVQGMGFSNRANGFVVALIFAVGAGAMVLCGWSSALRGERIWHSAVPWLVAASGIAAAIVAESNLFVLIAFAVAATGLYGAQGPFFSLPSSFLRGTAAAGGIALFSALGNLGGFFGPSLVGVLTERSGDYAAGLTAVVIEFVLAALIVLAAGRMIVARSALRSRAA